MGFNSVLFVCNNSLAAIGKDPQGFAEEISARMGTFDMGRFSFNGSGGFSIPHVGHSSETALVAVGGNHATKILAKSYIPVGHHNSVGQIALLKALADKLGYEVREKNR